MQYNPEIDRLFIDEEEEALEFPTRADKLGTEDVKYINNHLDAYRRDVLERWLPEERERLLATKTPTTYAELFFANRFNASPNEFVILYTIWRDIGRGVKHGDIPLEIVEEEEELEQAPERLRTYITNLDQKRFVLTTGIQAAGDEEMQSPKTEQVKGYRNLVQKVKAAVKDDKTYRVFCDSDGGCSEAELEIIRLRLAKLVEDVKPEQIAMGFTAYVPGVRKSFRIRKDVEETEDLETVRLVQDGDEETRTRKEQEKIDKKAAEELSDVLKNFREELTEEEAIEKTALGQDEEDVKTRGQAKKVKEVMTDYQYQNEVLPKTWKQYNFKAGQRLAPVKIVKEVYDQVNFVYNKGEALIGPFGVVEAYKDPLKKIEVEKRSYIAPFLMDDGQTVKQINPYNRAFSIGTYVQFDSTQRQVVGCILEAGKRVFTILEYPSAFLVEYPIREMANVERVVSPVPTENGDVILHGVRYTLGKSKHSEFDTGVWISFDTLKHIGVVLKFSHSKTFDPKLANVFDLTVSTTKSKDGREYPTGEQNYEIPYSKLSIVTRQKKKREVEPEILVSSILEAPVPERLRSMIRGILYDRFAPYFKPKEKVSLKPSSEPEKRDEENEKEREKRETMILQQFGQILSSKLKTTWDEYYRFRLQSWRYSQAYAKKDELFSEEEVEEAVNQEMADNDPLKVVLAFQRGVSEYANKPLEQVTDDDVVAYLKSKKGEISELEARILFTLERFISTDRGVHTFAGGNSLPEILKQLSEEGISDSAFERRVVEYSNKPLDQITDSEVVEFIKNQNFVSKFERRVLFALTRSNAHSLMEMLNSEALHHPERKDEPIPSWNKPIGIPSTQKAFTVSAKKLRKNPALKVEIETELAAGKAVAEEEAQKMIDRLKTLYGDTLALKKDDYVRLKTLLTRARNSDLERQISNSVSSLLVKRVALPLNHPQIRTVLAPIFRDVYKTYGLLDRQTIKTRVVARMIIDKIKHRPSKREKAEFNAQYEAELKQNYQIYEAEFEAQIASLKKPKTLTKTEQALDQSAKIVEGIARFESIAFEMHSNSTKDYLLVLISPITSLQLASIGVTFFANKFAAGKVNLSGLASVPLDYMFFELFTRNPEDPDLQAVEELLDLILKEKVAETAALYVRLTQPTKRLATLATFGTLETSLKKFVVKVGEVCGTVQRRAIDEDGKLVYEELSIKDADGNPITRPKFESTPEHDLKICFDAQKKTFTCVDMQTVIRDIALAKPGAKIMNEKGVIYEKAFIKDALVHYKDQIESLRRNPPGRTTIPFKPPKVKEVEEKPVEEVVAKPKRRIERPLAKVVRKGELKKIYAVGVGFTPFANVSSFDYTYRTPKGKDHTITVKVGKKHADAVVLFLDVALESSVEQVKVAFGETDKPRYVLLLNTDAISGLKLDSLKLELENELNAVVFTVSTMDQAEISDVLFNVVLNYEALPRGTELVHLIEVDTKAINKEAEFEGFLEWAKEVDLFKDFDKTQIKVLKQALKKQATGRGVLARYREFLNEKPRKTRTEWLTNYLNKFSGIQTTKPVSKTTQVRQPRYLLVENQPNVIARLKELKAIDAEGRTVKTPQKSPKPEQEWVERVSAKKFIAFLVKSGLIEKDGPEEAVLMTEKTYPGETITKFKSMNADQRKEYLTAYLKAVAKRQKSRERSRKKRTLPSRPASSLLDWLVENKMVKPKSETYRFLKERILSESAQQTVYIEALELLSENGRERWLEAFVAVLKKRKNFSV